MREMKALRSRKSRWILQKRPLRWWTTTPWRLSHQGRAQRSRLFTRGCLQRTRRNSAAI